MTKTSTASVKSTMTWDYTPIFGDHLKLRSSPTLKRKSAFQAHESKTNWGKMSAQANYKPFVNFIAVLKCFCIRKINPEEATIKGSNKEMLKTYLVQWSKNSSQLACRSSEIIVCLVAWKKASMAAIFPVFYLLLKFDLIYSHNIAEVKRSQQSPQFSSSSESE